MEKRYFIHCLAVIRRGFTGISSAVVLPAHVWTAIVRPNDCEGLWGFGWLATVKTSSEVFGLHARVRKHARSMHLAAHCHFQDFALPELAVLVICVEALYMIHLHVKAFMRAVAHSRAWE